jgi:hypothetical protein
MVGMDLPEQDLRTLAYQAIIDEASTIAVRSMLPRAGPTG